MARYRGRREIPKIIDDRHADIESGAPVGGDELARQQAIKQIEFRRRFKISTAAAVVGMALLVAVWATSEYHNAGGLADPWIQPEFGHP